jgi:glycerol-3-phosphate O-acyltransferase
MKSTTLLENNQQIVANKKNKNKKHKETYPQLYPEIEDWPIYKLHANRAQFIKDIEQFVFERITSKSNDLEDIIAKTLYQEKNRVKNERWKVDPPDESKFWGRIGSELIKKSLDQDPIKAKEINERLLREIINRYAEEIVGTFSKRIFLFARWFLTKFFSRLLNAVNGKIWKTRYRLYDHLKATGDIETIRSLMQKGTVVVLPTHFSNIDSVLIGYVLDGILGLPVFSYGAGLNLYNSGVAAYFMNRIGAYRVDRRKKNPIYLETIKAMSYLATRRGVNSIFFPGGTRSRSGMIESKLKLGLLGTLIEAQRANYQEGREDKIFIVPAILGYHFVLEGKFLVESHLKQTGKELYLKSKDKSNSIRKFIQFAWTLFWTSNEIVVAFGKPIDVMGNFVDKNGNSYGKTGQKVNLCDYFTHFDHINQDIQRESVYTKNLADKIVERYKKDNLVLSSHLVAFAAFNLLRHEHPELDLYGILRLPCKSIEFSKRKLIGLLSQLQSVLVKMEEQEEIQLTDAIRNQSALLLKDGLKKLGAYHATKPLKIYKGKIISQSFSLLYYYQNRLEGYELAQQIDWNLI